MKYPRFKICCFGERGSGKTSFLDYYIQPGFRCSMDSGLFSFKDILIDGAGMTMIIWDLIKMFPIKNDLFFKGAKGGIFVYDITNSDSIKNIDSWIKRFKENAQIEKVPFIIVGTKSDLEEKREISYEEGLELAGKYDAIKFFECSGKTGKNVEKIFTILAKEVMQRFSVEHKSFEEKMDSLIKEGNSEIFEKFLLYHNPRKSLNNNQETHFFNSLDKIKSQFFIKELKRQNKSHVIKDGIVVGVVFDNSLCLDSKLLDVLDDLEGLKELTTLKKLSAQANNLIRIPESITELKSLEVLFLNNNKIESLPENIGDLKHLKELWLVDNEIEILPESIGNLKLLKKLYLSVNNLSSIPESIGNLKSLEKLFLYRNKLTNLPQSIGNLKSLEEFNAEENDISALPDSIGNLVSLRKLELDWNKIKIFPETVGNLKKLNELDLSIKWMDVLSESIKCFKQVHKLNLSINRLKELPDSLADLKMLVNLNLSHNKLKEVPEVICKLKKLEVLDLEHNQIRYLPKSLESLVNLKELKLGSNRIRKIPPSLEKLISLEILDLSDNRLTKLPEFLKKIQKLELKGNLIISKVFKVNELITLKLINNKTFIYVNNKRFNQCMALIIEIPIEELTDLEEIESIDEAAAKRPYLSEWDAREKYHIPPETQFWGHCSNIQMWVENKYKTNLLHRNLAFPLLKKLTEAGDPMAKKVFKEEIARRYASGYKAVQEYLKKEGYLEYLNKDEKSSLNIENK
ncbi:MAG: leucine-rich repeat domain-containing protein [Promethearchaeota archaeon]